jgi:hypothetical protein
MISGRDFQSWQDGGALCDKLSLDASCSKSARTRAHFSNPSALSHIVAAFALRVSMTGLPIATGSSKYHNLRLFPYRQSVIDPDEKLEQGAFLLHIEFG